MASWLIGFQYASAQQGALGRICATESLSPSVTPFVHLETPDAGVNGVFRVLDLLHVMPRADKGN
jgi:hypothetical protein